MSDNKFPIILKVVSETNCDFIYRSYLNPSILPVTRDSQISMRIITNDSETSIRAKKIILAVGYHDVYPDIPGFIECWADTIIPCAFCDGYENRDRIWGIVVNSKMELEKLPKIAQNWTSKIKVFISPKMEITTSYQNELSKLGILI